MENFRVIVNKKSIFKAITVLCCIGLYFAFIRTQVEVTTIESKVILFELLGSFIITLIQIKIPEKYTFYLNIFYLIILSFYTSITLDFLNGTYELGFDEVIKTVIIRYLLSTFIALLIYLLLIAVFRNMKTACTIGCIILILVGIIC